MSRISLTIGAVLFVVSFAEAAQMVGYSVQWDTGLVTMFACEENGDPDCFRNRTVLGSIDPTFSTGQSAVVTVAPSGELVVGNPVWGDIRLDWLDLPSLQVVSSLEVVSDVQVVWDIAFGPDSTLWMTALPDDGLGGSLYVIDEATGVATEVWHREEILSLITFVGERMIMFADAKLVEVDPVNGTMRVIRDFASTWPGYPGLAFLSLTSFDNRLWTLSFIPPYPPSPWWTTTVATLDLETGEHEALLDEFSGPEDWTFDLVDSPDQQPAAVPIAGRVGVVVLVTLIGIGAWIVLRRRL